MLERGHGGSAPSGERHGHLPADVGRKQPPDHAVFAEGMGDYALATLFRDDEGSELIDTVKLIQ